jgi:hypothetical protein
LRLASDVKSVIWWIPTFISLSSRELDYKVTLKLLGGGQQTRGRLFCYRCGGRSYG